MTPLYCPKLIPINYVTVFSAKFGTDLINTTKLQAVKQSGPVFWPTQYIETFCQLIDPLFKVFILEDHGKILMGSPTEVPTRHHSFRVHFI